MLERRHYGALGKRRLFPQCLKTGRNFGVLASIAKGQKQTCVVAAKLSLTRQVNPEHLGSFGRRRVTGQVLDKPLGMRRQTPELSHTDREVAKSPAVRKRDNS